MGAWRDTEILEWFKAVFDSFSKAFHDALDLFTGFFTQISGDHRYIHDGRAFGFIDNTGSVSAGSKYAFSITTPPANTKKYIHLRPALFFATANATTMTITEGAAVSGGSDITTIYNFNRNVKNTSQMTAKKGVTVATPGTQVIWFDVTGEAGGPSENSGGRGGGAEHERVLKPGTTYSIEFEVIGSVTPSTSYVDLYWYEEDGL